MCNYNKDIFDSLYEQTKGFNEIYPKDKENSNESFDSFLKDAINNMIENDSELVNKIKLAL